MASLASVYYAGTYSTKLRVSNKAKKDSETYKNKIEIYYSHQYYQVNPDNTAIKDHFSMIL